MMNFSEIDIRTLLPQQEPFVMVDTLLQCDEMLTRTALTISESNLFVESGKFTEFGMIENFAQTCAARIGYSHKILKNESVKEGFIGAVRNFIMHKKPCLGEMLVTEIEIKSEVFNITLVNARAWVNDRLIAECEMKISEQN
jgi:predicted hotdog family 3-hydroxylacyl-ACP dehydratase